MEFRVLGPLEGVRDGEPVDLGPRKQRETLSLLLLNAGRVVSTERLLEGVWGDEAGAKENALWVTISRIRSTLDPERQANGDAVLVTKDHGYLLDVGADQLDVHRFESLVEAGRSSLDADPSGAAAALRQALDLWRGEAWADVRFHDFAQGEINRLEDLRLSAEEDLLAARLDMGETDAVAAAAAALVSANPLRERPVRLLMLGLYRSGRQAEALRAYGAMSGRLGEELGIEPSPEMQRLEEQMLLHDWQVRPRPAGTTGNPFKGLEPFREEDAVDFHGRDRIVSELVRRIGAGETLLTLVGASGSGKSSVVRAGVIPALRKGALPGSDAWLVATMVPGSHPFAELEAALVRSSLDAPSSLGEQLAEDGSGVLRAALRVMPDEQSRLVLVVDQFEELFTLVADPAIRDRFLDGLLTAAADPKQRITILLTLRADFYDRPLQHAAFANRFGDGVVNVAPLLPDELEEAASKPAQRVGASIEPALVGALVTDVLGRPGTLPLFQYVLTDLFESHDGTLTLDDYRSLGGLGGALSKRAEEAFGSLDEDGRAACRQLFLRMVAVAEGAEWSRRRLHADELRSLGFDAELLQHVVGILVGARLLTTDRDPASGRPTIEVAHEALLTVWERLAEWIDEASEDLRRHAVLAAAVREWLDADEDRGFLWAQTRLERYRTWAETASLDLTADETRFLGESTQTEEERAAEAAAVERRTRRRGRWLVAAAAGLVALAAWAVWPLLYPAAEPAEVALVRVGGNKISDQLAQGLEQAAAEFPVSVNDVVLQTDALAQVEAALAAEPDLLIATLDLAFLPIDWSQVTQDLPDTYFIDMSDGSLDRPQADDGDPGGDRWAEATFANVEGAALAGAVAAERSTSGVIGVVTPGIGFIGDFVSGYRSGAAFVDPAVEVLHAQSPYYLDQFGGIWDNRYEAAAAAARTIDEGADVVFQVHSGGGKGVLEEAARRGVWGIGVDSDEYLLLASTDPETAGAILTSVVKRFDQAVTTGIERFLAGEHGDYQMNLANGGFTLSESGGQMTSEELTLAQDLRELIIGGEVQLDPTSRRPAEILPPHVGTISITVTADGCTIDDPDPFAVGDDLVIELNNETDAFASTGVGPLFATQWDEDTMNWWEVLFDNGAPAFLMTTGRSSATGAIRAVDSLTFLAGCYHGASDTNSSLVFEPTR